MKMRWALMGGLALAAGCVNGETGTPLDLRASAERYFTGVFGCQPALIDELAAAEIVVSYPIFQSIFGTSSIRGREAVKQFAAGFCSRWSEPLVTVQESIQDDDRVVLIWEFEAMGAVSSPGGGVAAPARQRWGGISFLRFDKEGRVIEEIGEESTPGPIERVKRGK